MQIPKYFKQENDYTCSLAVLRMILCHFGFELSENDLLKKIENDYKKNSKNLWNTTILKIAAEYGLNSRLYAIWPLLKEKNINGAIAEFKNKKDFFDYKKYENKDDEETIEQPLPLAYKELFLAIEHGATVFYKGMDKDLIKNLLADGYLLQTNVKLEKLYPNDNESGFHSVLIYGIRENQVFYHDPYKGPSFVCEIDQIIKSKLKVAVLMAFKK